MDIYLRTQTRSEMDSALLVAGVLREIDTDTGETVLEPVDGVTIDRIGSVPPERDKDGAVLVPGDARYHVNARFAPGVIVPPVLPIVDPAPAVPHRKWFD